MRYQAKKFIITYALNIIFVISFAGLFGSMYLSQVLDLPPCDLCWWQRVLMYPIVPISIIASARHDERAIKYIMALALIGLPISIYHHLLKVTDLFPKVTSFCNFGAECAALDWELISGSGITIPFMAGLGFLAVIVVCLGYYIAVGKIKLSGTTAD